ncbi:MAG: N-acetylmuramoyl-L-alanine amidase [Ignavibacteria bacterium]|nr:MAG: N-acetylmuramoyl-L-alanine amidase [Ignavibacteria bacterium]
MALKRLIYITAGILLLSLLAEGERSGAFASPSDPPKVLSPKSFPIFGPEYAEVEVIDHELRGAVFYIVAGHGGPDSGAQGKRDSHTLCEDEYAYDVALRLARNLLEHDAKVYLITRDPDDGIRDGQYLACDSDETVWKTKRIPKKQLARLKQRTDIVNKLHRPNRYAEYERLIVLHVDSRNEGNRVDIFFYHHSASTKGRRTAELLQQTISDKYDLHQPDRGYRGFVAERDRLYMLRKTIPPTVYIELGNIRNAADQLRFVESDNRQAMGNWLCEGLMEDVRRSR